VFGRFEPGKPTEQETLPLRPPHYSRGDQSRVHVTSVVASPSPRRTHETDAIRCERAMKLRQPIVVQNHAVRVEKAQNVMVNHSGNFEIDIDVEAFVGDEPTNVGHVGKESLVFGPDWPIEAFEN